ncbi:hypothetical protein M3Y94_00402300 [Aphelenchoides besseyi]|nr:hypothetical protein M3Y94_00402300 [Aphelenchoides besseyi]KAI6218437.1 RING-type E3 ubiquitin transferase [Aphelenchoides besseyi]
MAPSSSSHLHSWADVLCCLNCGLTFARDRVPVNFDFGVICVSCMKEPSKIVNDKIKLPNDADLYPINLAFMKILGIYTSGLESVTLSGRFHNTNVGNTIAELEDILVEMSGYLRFMKTERGGAVSSDCLSRLVQRKLVAVLSAQMFTDEGRSNVLKMVRSITERIVTELVLNLQNSAHVSSYLWSAVRSRGCQFLGPAMQEDVLRLILLALIKGELIARKTLVLYIVQTMTDDYPHVSKTCVGHVVQLLYRASCFNVIKRDGESSLMQLKKEFRDYDKLRREHDAQIVQIALEAGLRISSDQWSSLLYGDANHRAHMESIVDSLQAPHLLNQAVVELRGLLAKSGDPDHLKDVLPEITNIIQIELNDNAAVDFDLLRNVFRSLRDILIAYSQFSKTKNYEAKFARKNDTKNSVAPLNGQRMYKTRLCRDVLLNRVCPRGAERCNYAHTSEELRPSNGKTPDLELQSTNTPYLPTDVQFVQNMPPPVQNEMNQTIMVDQNLQPMIPMVPVMIQSTPDVSMDPNLLKHSGLPPNPMFMFQPNEPPLTAPILIPPPPKPMQMFIGPPPGVPTLIPTAKNQQPNAAMNSFLYGPPAPMMMLQESLNGTTSNYSNGKTANLSKQSNNLDHVENGFRIPSTAWDCSSDDQHLLLRRHEIVTRLAQMRFDPIPREDCDEDSTSHVSYTVASSVLFDEFDGSPNCTNIELPPMPAIHSIPLTMSDAVLPPQPTGPFSVVSDIQLNLSTINTAPPQTNLPDVQAPASTSARLWSSVRTACPTTFFHTGSTAPATVQADCSRMTVTDMLERPLVISAIQRQNLSPQASYEAVDPVNLVDHVPQVIRPLTLNSNPQHIVSATLDRILNVKERILDLNMGAAVEKAQLNVELNIINQQISTLDDQTKQSCLLKELEAVDKKIDEMNFVV